MMPASFPLPPPDVADRATSSVGQTLLTVVVAVAAAAIVAIAVRLSWRRRSPVPVALAAGALLSATVEPLPDVTAQLWYYARGQHSIYTAYGNPFPIWTWFTYLVFYGGFGLLFWWLVERGWDRRRLLVACVPLAVYLGAAELFMINVVKVYTYYGSAAFVVAHYPVWIPLLNTSIIISIGVGGARIRRSLAPRDQALAALLLPGIAVVVGLLFVPMALWTAAHTAHPSSALIHLATVGTIVLALAVIRTATRFVPEGGFPPVGAPRAAQSHTAPTAPAPPAPGAAAPAGAVLAGGSDRAHL